MAHQKKNRTAYSNGRRRRTKSHTDEEVFAAIVKGWRPFTRGVHRGNVLNRLYTLTIGTLVAAKLMLRLETGGRFQFEGDPAVWENFEQMSDDLAEKFFVPFSKSAPWSQTGGIRLQGERQYLHLVRDRKTFRWC